MSERDWSRLGIDFSRFEPQPEVPAPPPSSEAGLPASAEGELPANLERWLRRSAWAVLRLGNDSEARQCAEELSAHFPPGKVEAIGESVQIDNRTKARS